MRSSGLFVVIETAPLPRTREPAAKSISLVALKLVSDLPVAPMPARPQTDVFACASTSARMRDDISILPRCVVTDVLSPTKMPVVAFAVTLVSDTGTPTRAPVFSVISSCAVTSVKAFSVMAPLFDPVPRIAISE